MANIYHKYMQLLKNWPIDFTKSERNLGVYIRNQVKVSFSKGDLSLADEEKCEKYYESLKRMTDNHYAKVYIRKFNSSSTGLTAEQCKLILSPEFLESFKSQEKNFVTRLFDKVRMK